MPTTEATRRFYAAEQRVERWRNLGSPIEVFGSVWDVEPETHFGVDRAATAFLNDLAARLSLPPVSLRKKRGFRQASYEAPNVIAIPDTHQRGDAGGLRIRWATLYTMCHEMAHHAHYHHGPQAPESHGPEFQAHMITILRLAGQDVTAHLLTLACHDAGVAA